MSRNSLVIRQSDGKMRVVGPDYKPLTGWGTDAIKLLNTAKKKAARRSSDQGGE